MIIKIIIYYYLCSYVFKLMYLCVFVAFFERELYHEGAIDLPQPNPVTDHKQPQLCDGVKDLIGGEDESQCREISQLHTRALARTHSRTHAHTHTDLRSVSLGSQFASMGPTLYCRASQPPARPGGLFVRSAGETTWAELPVNR
jgi:hypothetical protein